MEAYAHPPSKRQSRMKIDSLLNPSADEAEDTTTASTTSPYSAHVTLSSHSGYAPSPGYPPSPNGPYWYGRYQGYHDTSPGAASTATTHASSTSSASMNAHHQHPHNAQHHHHHMFLSYRPGTGPGSTHSSPDPYHPRERYDSVSSSSSTNGTDRRRPREWKEVRESFNRQFPSRQRRGFQGIQCKFYRFIKEKKCPTLREQRRMRDGEFLREGAAMGADSGAPRFGVVEWANVWYPWMREDRETAMANRQRMLAAS
ncbi:hypothetical protein N7492_003110 [Penicillium capsulatum]|uniref:Uncharacterized protein n=1 Tax=Penicillium capsulatum TaxID=69766 RepID=A0A9W9IJZ1_9EURO|nr:hypothetical protein N7492_003110 [Penicillium capsulatum]